MERVTPGGRSRSTWVLVRNGPFSKAIESADSACQLLADYCVVTVVPYAFALEVRLASVAIAA